MELTKHVTLYGDSLKDQTSVEWDYLDLYDYIICSPGVYNRIIARKPELSIKCFLYFNFFTSPRKVASATDIISCPGDVYPGREIFMKHSGGDSHIYYITWEWAALFVKEITEWMNKRSRNSNNIGGIFLDEWTISHTWWNISDAIKNATQVSSQEQRKMMEFIELQLLMTAKAVGNFDFIMANGERIYLNSPGLRIYFESVGSSWNGWDKVIRKTVEGDLWQINSSKEFDRWIAVNFGAKLGVSVGMQPADNVLSYNIVEDPRGW